MRYALSVTTYSDAGVDIQRGDAASACAYAHARGTHASRMGKIGAPVPEHEGGFAGLLDMGSYFLVQTSDGTGTKMELAEQFSAYASLGRDLLAMVADDAVCTGAEVIGVSNTLDVPKADVAAIDPLLRGLSVACAEQGIAMTGGEIAEVPGSVSLPVWNATAVGILEKPRLLRPESIVPGDTVLALRERGCRSNGFSLIRRVLRTAERAWGEEELRELLRPSTIYHAALLALLGRFGEQRRVPLKGLAHITGGGIPSKLRRILKKAGYGAALHDLWPPPPVLVDLMTAGNIAQEEAYRTFCMGNGMLAVLSTEEATRALALLQGAGIEARVAGVITCDPAIVIATGGGDLRFC